MSEGKIKNEFNADDVNFESHDDTAKNDITELSDTVADTALPSSDEKTAEHALEEAEISVSPSVSESTDADETVTDSFRESSEGEGDGDSANTEGITDTDGDEGSTDTYEGATAEAEDEAECNGKETSDATEEEFPKAEGYTEDPNELTDNVEARDVEDDGYSEDGETYEDDLDTESEEEDAEDDVFGDGTEEDIDYDAFLDEEDVEEEKKVGTRFVDSLFDFIELFIFSLAAVFVITTFFFRHSVVDGSSMERTLFDGEHIIISDLFYKPERGDIIVCEDYSTELPIPIVKRVIAIAGDRVEIDVEGNVKVNGELLDESGYVYIDPNFPYHCDELAITVPEGEIFVMGDHRNVSSDSRKIGTIKEDSILGRVLFRFYPFDKFGAVE